MGSEWRTRGYMTDQELEDATAPELRDAIRMFRSKNPEIEGWLKYKKAIFGILITGAFFGGGQLDPVSMIRARLSGQKPPPPPPEMAIAANFPPGSSVTVDQIKDVVVAETARLLVDYGNGAQRYTDEQVGALKGDINREFDRVYARIESIDRKAR